MYESVGSRASCRRQSASNRPTLACRAFLSRFSRPGDDGKPAHAKKVVDDYIVEIDEDEKDAYNNQRVTSTVAAE